ncbi:hypothetical protein MPDQ_002914, partial [Monascus purpureus]
MDTTTHDRESKRWLSLVDGSECGQTIAETFVTNNYTNTPVFFGCDSELTTTYAGWRTAT